MDEQDPRFRVAAARRILARAGCDSGVAGHVSVRAPGADTFHVSAFGFFDETTPEQVVGADLSGAIVEGDWPASPAVKFHAAFYRARPAIGSVIHTHSHWVSTFVTRERPIGMYNVASVLFHDEQVLHTDDGTKPPVPGDDMAAKLGDRSVILIKNHGAIVVSDTLEKATILALTLEQAARYHLEAEAAGGTEFPVAEARRGKQKYHQHYLPQMWAACYRRLRRSDPDLFASAG
jgi:L-fuculose-phosphate aldolase